MGYVVNYETEMPCSLCSHTHWEQAGTGQCRAVRKRKQPSIAQRGHMMLTGPECGREVRRWREVGVWGRPGTALPSGLKRIRGGQYQLQHNSEAAFVGSLRQAEDPIPPGS